MAAGHSNGLSSVPEHIPGVLIEQPEHRHMLRTHLAQMTDQHTLRWVLTSYFLAYLLGPSAEAFLHLAHHSDSLALSLSVSIIARWIC